MKMAELKQQHVAKPAAIFEVVTLGDHEFPVLARIPVDLGDQRDITVPAEQVQPVTERAQLMISLPLLEFLQPLRVDRE